MVTPLLNGSPDMTDAIAEMPFWILNGWRIDKCRAVGKPKFIYEVGPNVLKGYRVHRAFRTKREAMEFARRSSCSAV